MDTLDMINYKPTRVIDLLDPLYLNNSDMGPTQGGGHLTLTICMASH